MWRSTAMAEPIPGSALRPRRYDAAWVVSGSSIAADGPGHCESGVATIPTRAQTARSTRSTKLSLTEPKTSLTSTAFKVMTLSVRTQLVAGYPPALMSSAVMATALLWCGREVTQNLPRLVLGQRLDLLVCQLCNSYCCVSRLVATIQMPARRADARRGAPPFAGLPMAEQS